MAFDQKLLNPELTSWLTARQSALNIVKTSATPSGRIIDWVPIESQDPTGHIASPPPATTVTGVDDAQRPTRAVTFELDDPAVERGPAGTVPIVRPDLSQLTRTIALKNFLTKKGGVKIRKPRANRGPVDPDPAGYYHAQAGQTLKNYGCDFLVNVWNPTIDVPSSSGEDHSIMQIWLQNYSKPQSQSVEGGWTVDQSLNNDLVAHIFTYYTTNGYNGDGDNLGGYNRLYEGWVQSSTTIFPGSKINGVSTLGGQQVELSMKFQLHRDPASGQSNWWISVQNEWMGYYPASLFNGGIGNGADDFSAGGEVFSGLADPTSTKDQMGSGWQAEAGWTRAAYMRNLRVQTDLDGTMADFNGATSSDTATGSGQNPYDIKSFMNSGGAWASYFYLGGQTPVPTVTANLPTGSGSVV